MELFVAIFILLVIVLYLADRHFLTYWKKEGFKQLNPCFIFGDIRGLVFQQKSVAEFFQDIYRKNKHLEFVGFYNSYRPALLVMEPQLIQKILITDFGYFHDRAMPVNEEKDPLSAHLFSITGQKWRDLRVKLSPTFTSGKLKAMFPTLKDQGDILEQYLISNVKEGNNVMEFRDLLARYGTNVISSVAFGIECDCINEPNHIFRKMGAKFFEKTFKNGFRNLISFLVPEYLYTFKLKFVDDEIEDFMLSVVKQTVEYREKNKVTRNDFMQLLIQLKDQGFVSVDKTDEGYEENGNKDETTKITKLSFNELSAQAFLFFIGGFETTSSTMSFCLFELAKNSKLQRKVQAEIDQIMKSAGKEGITYDLLGKMTYLESCIDETLRKYPPAPMLMRKCVKDYKLPRSDLVIHEDSHINIPIYSIQRDPEIYENPLEFKPERFINNPSGSDKVKGLFYLPFGDGPRNCIGMRIGKLIIKTGLALMLSKFSFELHDKTMAEQELKFNAAQFVLTPEKPFDLKIKVR